MHSHDRTMLARLGFADPDKKNPLHDLACQYLAIPANAQALIDLFVPPSEVPTENAWHKIGVAKGTRQIAPTFSKSNLEYPINKGQGQYQTTVGFLDVVLQYKTPWKGEGKIDFDLRFDQLLSPWDSLTEVHHGRLLWKPESGAALASSLLECAQPILDQLQALQQQMKAVTHLPSVASVSTAQIRYYNTAQAGNHDILSHTVCACCVPSCPCRAIFAVAAEHRKTPIKHSVPYRSTGESWAGSLVIEVKATPTGIGEVLRQFNLYKSYQELLGLPSVTWILATTYDISAEDLATLKREDIKHVKLGMKFERWCVAQRTTHTTPAKAVEI